MEKDVAHIYSGILLSHKNNEIMPFAATWMNLEIIIPSEEIIIPERERQIPYDIIYMWNLKYDTNLPMKQKQAHRHRKQTCGCQEGRWIGSLRLADANYYT